MFPGDKNGVCWHLGTNYGTQPWVNPMLAGRASARASSPACRNTDPRAIVGHSYLHSNFAGPRLENGQLSRRARDAGDGWVGGWGQRRAQSQRAAGSHGPGVRPW